MQILKTQFINHMGVMDEMSFKNFLYLKSYSDSKSDSDEGNKRNDYSVVAKEILANLTSVMEILISNY